MNGFNSAARDCEGFLLMNDDLCYVLDHFAISDSIKAITKRGIAVVRSRGSRTRCIADSSGWHCPARLASILARSASPGTSTSNLLMIAITVSVATQSQWAHARYSV